jgi:hypothetical protein
MQFPAVLLLISLALPPSVAAQRVVPAAFPSFQAPPLDSSEPARLRAVSAEEGASEGQVIMGSLFGGLGTFWLTAYLASRLHGTPCEDCGLEEGLYGAAMGFGLGAALGAHLANHREGPFGKSALIGMAIGAVGTLAAIESDEWRLLLAVPVAQIASAVALERRAQRD